MGTLSYLLTKLKCYNSRNCASLKDTGGTFEPMCYRPPPAQAHAHAHPAQAHAQLLPLEELLLTGAGFWSAVGIMAAAIPPIVFSDHPAKEPATSRNVGACPLLGAPRASTATPRPPPPGVVRAHRGQ